jgi:hypothetical protein
LYSLGDETFDASASLPADQQIDSSEFIESRTPKQKDWRTAGPLANAHSIAHVSLLDVESKRLRPFHLMGHHWAGFSLGGSGLLYLRRKDSRVFTSLGFYDAAALFCGPLEVVTSATAPDRVFYSFHNNMGLEWVHCFHLEDPHQSASTQTGEYIGIAAKLRRPVQLVDLGLHQRGLLLEAVDEGRDNLRHLFLERRHIPGTYLREICREFQLMTDLRRQCARSPTNEDMLRCCIDFIFADLTEDQRQVLFDDHKRILSKDGHASAGARDFRASVVMPPCVSVQRITS